MLDPILITPDNRLLAFSTHDFSLYGAQTPVGLHIGPAQPDAVAARALETSPDAAAIDDGASGEFSTSGMPHLASATPSEVPAYAVDGLPFAQGAASTVPEPAAGAPIQSAIAPPAGSSGGAAPGAAGNASPPASTAALAAQTSDLTVPLSDTLNSLSALTDGPVHALDSLATGLIGTVLPPLTQAGADVVQAATAPVQTVLNTADGLTDGLITTILPTDLAQAPGAVLQAGDAAIDSVVQQIDAAPLAAATSGPLFDADSALLDDDLSGMLGSDPAGGVSTLVSLVSVNDMFDVADTSALPATELTPAPQLLDALADVPVEHALLGDVHDDDSPLGDHAGADPLGVL